MMLGKNQKKEKNNAQTNKQTNTQTNDRAGENEERRRHPIRASPKGLLSSPRLLLGLLAIVFR